jgi:large subunit ribosomal protein LP0
MNLTMLSLGSGYLIQSAMPHVLCNAFKNLAGAALASDYSFPALDKLKSAAKAGPATGSAPKAAAAAAAEEAPAEEEPEEDVDMGGLFGGDDEDDY